MFYFGVPVGSYTVLVCTVPQARTTGVKKYKLARGVLVVNIGKD